MTTNNDKQQIFQDVYDGIIPKRVPINATLPLEFCIQYDHLDLAKTQWTLEGVLKAADKLCELIPFDLAPLGTPRYPSYLSILGAKTYQMGDSGFMQHPEIMGMQAEDYDTFIQNPRDFILEKVMPRLFENWNTDPINRSLFFAESILAHTDIQNKHNHILKTLREKHSFFSPPPGSVSGTTVPFDYLSDFLRSFTGISGDIKRCPEKVRDACDALLPYIYKKAMPSNPSKYGQTFMPLHMATYLRKKEFETLFLPSFSKLVHAMADAGQPCYLFCESDWSRYLDYLYDLPSGTRFCFEYGDPRQIKEKLGKKHILSGLYPVTYLKTATQQECIDKAKSLIDIMAPGGNYIFNFDKNPFSIKDINLDNYSAVINYVANHSNYSNPGERSLSIFEDTHHESIQPFTSKYCQPIDIYTTETLKIRSDLVSTATPLLNTYKTQVDAFLNKII